MRTRTTGELETWRCDACGAYTDEPLQVCGECQAKRLDGPILSSGKKTRRSRKPGAKAVKTTRSRKKSAKDVQVPKREDAPQATGQEESKLIEPESDLPTVVQPEPSEPPEIDYSIDPPQDSMLDDDPDGFVAEPTNQKASPDEAPESLGESPGLAPSSESNIGGSVGDRFSLVYVNTPVPELIKRKIDIDFETFPTISIGRSPENVVVIPDAGVSRTHAELRKEGNRLILRDLQSSNGTYIYDGKEFRRVEVEGEVSPNSLVKLGTGTILRLVFE